MTYNSTVLADGALVYWPLHDAAGSTTVTDLYATPHPGTVTSVTLGATPLGTAIPKGSPGTVAQGDGVAGHGITSSAMTVPTNTFSIEIWARPVSTTPNYGESASGTYGTSGAKWVVWPDHHASNHGMGIAVGTNAVEVWAHGDAFLPCISRYATTISDWVHIVVTLASNSSTPLTYVNGVLVKTGSFTASSSTTTYASTTAGTGPYGGYDGEYAMFAQYPTVLTPTQIANHYNLGITSLNSAFSQAPAYGSRSYGGSAGVSNRPGPYLLQQKYAVNTGAASTTQTVTLDSTPSNTDLLVLSIYEYSGTGNTQRVTSVTGYGASWTKEGTTTIAADGIAASMWVGRNPSNSTAVTITSAGGQQNEVNLAAYGNVANAPVRSSASYSRDIPGAPTHLSGGSVSALQGDLVVSMFIDNGSAGNAVVVSDTFTALTNGGFGDFYPAYTVPIISGTYEHTGDVTSQNYYVRGLTLALAPALTQTLPTTTAVGSSTVTFGMGVKRAVAMSPSGVSNVVDYLSSPYHAFATSAGKGSVTKNTLTRIPAGNYFTIYPSHPPYNSKDVALGTKDGAGAQQGLFMTSAGVASLSETLGVSTHLVTTMAGVASGSWRLSNKYSVRATSAGIGHLTAYLGSPTRMTASSAGVGHATAYLGTKVYPTATSAGVGHLTAYLGSPYHVTSTSAGRATMVDYLSSPQQISASSAGVGHMTSYLSAPFHITSTSVGIGHMTNYLSAPFHVTSTSAGIGHMVDYLSSPLQTAFTSAGIGHMTSYLSSPLQVSSTSRGVATVTARLPQIYGVSGAIHGVGHMTATEVGPVYMNAASHGVAGGQILTGRNLDMAAHGISHMTLVRPTGVFMQWGNPYYYAPEFPIADPILQPAGSNGISHMTIEIDTIPILRNKVHGESSMTFDGLLANRPMAWSNRFNPFSLRDRGDFAHNYEFSGLPQTQGGTASVSATLYQAPAIIVSNGIGHMDAPIKVAYLVRWQRAGDSRIVARTFGSADVGFAGAEGHFTIAGPPQLVIRPAGQGGMSPHMTGIFANVALIHGIAHMTVHQSGGGLSIYGDLLAQLFSITHPAYGQLWPRRIVMPV